MCSMMLFLRLASTVCKRRTSSYIAEAIARVPFAHYEFGTLSQRGIGSASSIVASSPQQPLFELRTYSVRPCKMQEFLKLTNEEFGLRTKHSKLVGYWTCELGGLNQVVHLWFYGNLQQRAEVRAALGKCQEWQSKYVSKILPMMQVQENLLLTFVSEPALSLARDCAVYELHLHRLEPCGKGDWRKALEAFLRWNRSNPPNVTESHSQPSFSLAGAFETMVGPLNTLALLWQHKTVDGCEQLKHNLSQQDEYNFLAQYFKESNSKILAPFVVHLWD